MKFFLKIILFPFSILYGIILFIRHFLYDTTIKKTHYFTTPTICIGNIGMGGTGKTPMTEYLIRLLKNDYKIAVLSRGYKRKSNGFILASAQSTSEILGDEPFLFHYKNPEISVAVCENRAVGIERILLEKPNTEVILLDDAFQHRKVTPSFSMILTPFYDIYPNDCLVPAGRLRDIKSRAKKADCIFITKSPNILSEEEKTKIIQKIKPHKNQSVFFTGIRYASEIKSVNKTQQLSEFLQKPFYLVVGISNPTPLIQFLKEQNADFEILRFSNHHFFSEKEIDFLKTKSPILTTEKDFVRLYSFLPNAFYLPIETYFISALEEKLFIEKIKNCIEKKQD